MVIPWVLEFCNNYCLNTRVRLTWWSLYSVMQVWLIFAKNWLQNPLRVKDKMCNERFSSLDTFDSQLVIAQFILMRIDDSCWWDDVILHQNMTVMSALIRMRELIACCTDTRSKRYARDSSPPHMGKIPESITRYLHHSFLLHSFRLTPFVMPQTFSFIFHMLAFIISAEIVENVEWR